MSERLRGVVMLFVGIASTFAFVYLPLTMAAQHSNVVYVTTMGAILVPISFGFGLLYVVLGPTATEIFGTRSQPKKPAVYLFCLVFTAAGLGLHFWLRGALHGAGYHFASDIADPPPAQPYGAAPPQPPVAASQAPYDTTPKAPPVAAQSASNGATPKDLGEALDWVKNGYNDDIRKIRGAEWLANAPVDPARRQEVAAEVEKLRANPITRLAGMRALAVWAGPENGPTLLQELQYYDTLATGDTDGAYVADALARIQYAPAAAVFAYHLTSVTPGGPAAAARRLATLGPIAEKEVLKFMDSHSPSAREEAAQLLGLYGTKRDVMIDQALADLKSNDAACMLAAGDFFAATPVDEARRAEVSRALAAAMSDNAMALVRPSPYVTAARALQTWGTSDSVPALIKGMENNDAAPECMKALGRIKDERAVDPLLLQTAAGKLYVTEAQKALNEMGPVVETALDKEATDPANPATNKVVVCQLLALQIGTKASIPALRAACADPDPRVKAMARAALAAVQKRNP